MYPPTIILSIDIEPEALLSIKPYNDSYHLGELLLYINCPPLSLTIHIFFTSETTLSNITRLFLCRL